MKERMTATDLLMNIFPGYIWLSAFIFIVAAGLRMPMETLETQLSMELIFLSIPLAYILGHTLAEGTKTIGGIFLHSAVALKEEDAVKIMVQQKFKERQFQVHLYEALEYQLDDMLKLKGIKDTWTKYMDMANLTKQLYLAGVVFTLSFLSYILALGNLVAFSMMMVGAIFILYLLRMSYIKLVRQYFRQVQLNFLLSCDLDIL